MIPGIVASAVRAAIGGGGSATGGDEIFEIQDGGVAYRVHVFYGDGLLEVQEPLSADVLLVGGGGGGGTWNVSGGGGGGDVVSRQGFSIPSGSHPIVVGTGGKAGSGLNTDNIKAAPGGDSTAFGLNALGGGESGSGGNRSSLPCGNFAGGDGGSGGGSGGSYGSGCSAGFDAPGSGLGENGHDGGVGVYTADASSRYGGGGGGAGSPGSGGGASPNGGSGIESTITGGSVYYGGGGGGGANTSLSGSGGLGGGGDGGNDSTRPQPGEDGKGGGAGGLGENTPDRATGVKGGDGVVIVRYPI